MKHVLIIPLHIEIRRKKHYLNLNNYRNWHHYLSNNIKRKFKKVVQDQLYFKLNHPKIIYQLYYPDMRKRDKMNIICIVDKFLMDSLVECGCLVDDSDEFIREVIVNQPIYDKGKSYCEVIFENDKFI